MERPLVLQKGIRAAVCEHIPYGRALGVTERYYDLRKGIRAYGKALGLTEGHHDLQKGKLGLT